MGYAALGKVRSDWLEPMREYYTKFITPLTSLYTLGEKTALVRKSCFIAVPAVPAVPLHVDRDPTRTGKPGNLEGILQLGNFEQTGKVRENHTKYWKTQRISDKYYLLFFTVVIFK